MKVSWSHETERRHAERKESEKQVGDMKLILKVGKNCELWQAPAMMTHKDV
jgi:hypothetical protein